MDTKELLKKVRKIEIKTRRLSDNIFGGEYHSTFKGRGMTFSEVRQYQYGDDVRSIDWNVTATASNNQNQLALRNKHFYFWGTLNIGSVSTKRGRALEQVSRVRYLPRWRINWLVICSR